MVGSTNEFLMIIFCIKAVFVANVTYNMPFEIYTAVEPQLSNEQWPSSSEYIWTSVYNQSDDYTDVLKMKFSTDLLITHLVIDSENSNKMVVEELIAVGYQLGN